MPEYFDISFIENIYRSQVEHIFYEIYKIRLGSNFIEKSRFELLGIPGFIFSSIDENDSDFKEYVLSFPNIVFHKECFKEDIKKFTCFIDDCFAVCDTIQFALCSYEINGSLIGDKHKFKDFSKAFLCKFPIVYERILDEPKPTLHINYLAQEILI